MQTTDYWNRHAFTKTVLAPDTNDLNIDDLRTPAGSVLCITNISAFDATTNNKNIVLKHVVNGREYALKRGNVSTTQVSVDWQGQIFLGPGDFARATILSPAASDSCTLTVEGYYLVEPTR